MSAPVLPDQAYAVALLCLPSLWPARLAALLGLRRVRGPDEALLGDDPMVARRSAREAWSLVRDGRAGADQVVRRALGGRADVTEVTAAWARAAIGLDVEALWARHVHDGVRVDLLGSPGYPTALASDPSAPYAVFRKGSATGLEGPCVAIIGTRRCTPLGRDIAIEFAETLSRAGAKVVSGLALGIDGAAHEGALRASRATPIGVVAGGFDIPYPARHRRLWLDVAAAGALVSEWPLGTRSEGWRFPARNRIIAALADAVVVIESRASGGSMITAEQALVRGKAVFAVPGSIRSPASIGTNRLLCDGAIPACAVDDVIDTLGLRKPVRRRAQRPEPVGTAAEVLLAVGWEPTPIDVVLRRCDGTRASVTLDLAHLEMAGWLCNGPGGWQRLQAEGSQSPDHAPPSPVALPSESCPGTSRSSPDR